jgi:hypothetical protein
MMLNKIHKFNKLKNLSDQILKWISKWGQTNKILIKFNKLIIKHKTLLLRKIFRVSLKIQLLEIIRFNKTNN